MVSRVQGGAVAKLGAAAVLVAALVLTGGRGPDRSVPDSALSDSRGSGAFVPNDTIAKGKHGVVVTQEPHATAVGLEVLRQGGNAVDAAVAVARTLAVTFPQAGEVDALEVGAFGGGDGEPGVRHVVAVCEVEAQEVRASGGNCFEPGARHTHAVGIGEAELLELGASGRHRPDAGVRHTLAAGEFELLEVRASGGQRLETGVRHARVPAAASEVEEHKVWASGEDRLEPGACHGGCSDQTCI